ncbi:hypothetical protein [Mucilaginibacter terrae]|uniref:Uncharacterized protein n=1 Tax=Mucilaginibacter terrae TaxID=1955052 RepID=A0ABU3GT36_9SPHI|nr:hypothetical protein [Mucilaginibacter terrae]MDT3402938.1 hypothetical protein [Mucilaginibacter terrae]
MNSLRGSSVRITVHKPVSLKNDHLFGTVIYERHGNKLIVKLTENLKGTKVTSNMVLLSPQNVKETFKPGNQHYAVMVNGTLISEDHQELETTLSGTLSFD